MGIIERMLLKRGLRLDLCHLGMTEKLICVKGIR